jgi:hypothetical protein
MVSSTERGVAVEDFMRLLSRVANQVDLVASDDKNVSYRLRLAGWDENDGTGRPTIIFIVESKKDNSPRRRQKAPSLVKAVARSIQAAN